MVVRAANRLPGDEHQVPTGFDRVHPQPDGFAQPPANPVSFDCLAQAVADREAEAAVRKAVGQSAQNKNRVAIGSAFAPDLLKTLVLANAIPSFHPHPSLKNEKSSGLAGSSNLMDSDRAGVASGVNGTTGSTCAWSGERPAGRGLEAGGGAGHSGRSVCSCGRESRAFSDACGLSAARCVLSPSLSP